MKNKNLESMLDNFLDILREVDLPNVFNPWWQNDSELDDYTNAYEIRQHQLKAYLRARATKCKFLLVGEALGYQGGRFTGIPMVSERMLLGHHVHKNIYPENVFASITPTRTSKVELKKDGFNEPTATIVWQHLLSLNIAPEEFCIWNALAWHPYSADKGALSNRTPTDKEVESGILALNEVIRIIKPKIIIAVGEKASISLTKNNIKHFKVRHPANGGANKFREQFKALL